MSIQRSLYALSFLLCCQIASAQQIIQLYNGKPAGSETWTHSEKEMFSPIFNTQIVYNVVQPTLTVFVPTPSVSNGTAVVIAPGGGFQMLSINSEGIDVAKWLAAKGVTCFVLKYRLVESKTDNPVVELMSKLGGESAEIRVHLGLGVVSVQAWVRLFVGTPKNCEIRT